ncbi:MAG: DUF1559 domain-containing protein, partial [Victivallales bacterium]|nr:DUF1559 domain-containing protein [Victivallales bacterium]
LLPALSKAREKARTISCTNNMKQVMLTLFMYAQDYEGLMPAPWANTGWSRVLKDQGYIGDYKGVQCPVGKLEDTAAEGSQSYGMWRTDTSSTAVSHNLEKFTNPSSHPFLVDCLKQGTNAWRQTHYWDAWYSTSGCVALIHGDACNMSFLDGHVETWNRGKFTGFKTTGPTVGAFAIWSGTDAGGTQITF